jgi:putative acetyltransferase
MSEWAIDEDDLTGPDIRALLELHFEGMLANSPEGSCHFLDIDGLRGPDVTFWSIRSHGALAGCGALREIDDGHGELKSMRTSLDHLGRGVGRRLLVHIVDVARDRGYGRVSLETGSTPAFDAARHLYTSFGFDECEPFAGYEANPFSRFYTLDLAV